MPSAPRPELAGSRAILLGTSEFHESLPDVPAALNSLHMMRELLTGPLCGWPADQVETLANQTAADGPMYKLNALFKETPGVLLVYYVGHGLPTHAGGLCLALSDTRNVPDTLTHADLQLDWLQRTMGSSGAALKILILDCCFSGIATGLLSAALPITPRRGVYTLTASHALENARYETEGDRPLTQFTKALAAVVNEGVPGAPETLTFHDIVPVLRRRLLAAFMPDPQARAEGDAHMFGFARNAAPVGPVRDLPGEVSQLRTEVEQLRDEVALLRRELRRAQPVAGEQGQVATGQSGPLSPPADRTDLKIVVIGGFGAGKTTFISAVSDIPPLATEARMTTAGAGEDDLFGMPDKTTLTTGRDYGRVDLPADLRLHLFAPPGATRYWSFWDDLVAGAHAAVVLLDVRRLADSFASLDYAERRGLPFVVAVNAFDGRQRYSLEQVREALDVPVGVPMLACDARVRTDVRQVLVESLEAALKSATARLAYPSPGPRTGGLMLARTFSPRKFSPRKEDGPDAPSSSAPQRAPSVVLEGVSSS